MQTIAMHPCHETIGAFAASVFTGGGANQKIRRSGEGDSQPTGCCTGTCGGANDNKED
ncbi:MAG TPA: hypothetical protein VEX86_24760 [Longimicrobium sp.]|nr:hypothetical protein [Longimicrobium sp.]